MRQEIKDHEINGTWELRELPKDRKAIRYKWGLRTVISSAWLFGDVRRDWASIYAPLVRYSTIRCLMTMVAKHDLEIDQMNAVTGFLQSTVDEKEL